MRYSAPLLAIIVFFCCSMTPAASGQSEAANSTQKLVSDGQTTATESPVGFLIDSAAADFHAQRQPHPVRFRHVRLGRVMASDGAEQHFLCGEFLPTQERGKAEWTPFATIKTSGYEQWLGAQAASFCHRSTIIWEKRDLSPLLQSRFDSTH